MLTLSEHFEVALIDVRGAFYPLIRCPGRSRGGERGEMTDLEEVTKFREWKKCEE